MDNKTHKLLKIIAVLVICAYALFTVFTFRLFNSLSPVKIIGNINTLKKASEIEGYINRNFYKDVDKSQLSEGYFKGLVDSLDDPYSTYLTKEEYEAFKTQSSGKYAGIGASLYQDPQTKVISVREVFPESPAEKAGLKTGDIIISADGNLAKQSELSTFVTYLRGEPGTKVSVIYERDGKETTVDIKREKITTPSVKWHMVDENTGYIHITDFMDNTEKEFKNAISDLETQGMTDVIYDLRGNPGGLVAVCVDMLDDMLPEGIVVSVEDKYGNKKDYTSDEENKLTYPCVILIDESSASCSEIFAGALKDYKYGTLLGTTTYGKGVIQYVYPLGDGSALKLTVAQYFTPKGNNIHEKGIKPDVELPYEYLGDENEDYTWEKDNQILKAIEMLD